MFRIRFVELIYVINMIKILVHSALIKRTGLVEPVNQRTIEDIGQGRILGHVCVQEFYLYKEEVGKPDRIFFVQR